MNVRTALSAVLLGSLVSLVSSPSVASEEPTPVDEWSEQFGIDSGEAEAWLIDEAAENGLAPESLAEAMLEQTAASESAGSGVPAEARPLEIRPLPSMSSAELRRVRASNEVQQERTRALYAAAAKGRFASARIENPPESVFEEDDPYMASSDGSGGSGADYVPLVDAKYRGDIFYYPVKTAGIEHGHVAIYRWVHTIVEAANKNLGVRKIDAGDRNVPDEKTVLFWIGSNFSKQEAAADWSNQVVGSSYRPWYSTKNKFLAEPFNCSQLVWASYKKQDTALDRDGGDYVWPIDIVEDGQAHPYQRV